jgi:hypothetical protein
MEKWLTAHAAQNAWQRPYLDGQLNVRPARLTPVTGGIGFVREAGGITPMPEQGSWWHVFHIGKLHSSYGNLAIGSGMWKRVSACINAFSAFILLYNEAGVTIPAHNAYFYRRPNGAVLLAIPQSDRYKWLETDGLYVRFYPGYDGGSNAPLINPTSIEYFTISTLQMRQKAFDRYAQLKANAKGYVTLWVNGKCIENPVLGDVTLWDDFEIRVDGRVKRVVDFRCGDLASFVSALDQKRKYLIHLPKQSGTWSFNNDIELHVLFGREVRYYHRHRQQAVRNLSWNDMSIPTERISQLRNSYAVPVNDIDDMIIRVLIRDDFLDLAPLFNTDHVHELYKMSDEQIMAALVGADATLGAWQASNLEQSYANRLAAAKPQSITRDFCTKAYGYNAVARYSADTPQRLTMDARGWGCRLPALLAQECTVYEYDGNGLLLGYQPHAGGEPMYYAVNPQARIVEAIVGTAGTSVNITDNAPDFTIADGDNVGLWIRTLKNEVPTDTYAEAVEGTDYTRNGNLITWKVDRTRRHPTVIHDNQHLFFELDVELDEGEIRIPILATNQEGDQRTLWIPMETVEIWMNQHPLVHSIDYITVWPEAVVVCKAWSSDTDTNHISVRARGVTGLLKIPKCGFVANGLFSNNSQFDVRDDKVIRVVAGGGLLLRDEVVFREDSTVGTDIVPDGFPFSVDDPTIPLRDTVTGDTYELRDAARTLDKSIEDYLTVKLPTPPPNPVVDIAHYYHLFSPLLNKLLWDHKSGALTLTEDDPNYRISTQQLDEIMQRYNDLLKFDPAYIGYDEIFVKVHPHVQYSVMEVDELMFAFADRVNQRYLRGKVQLNQYLKIKG